MTEQTTGTHIPVQGGPPLADTSDMANVHKVFREAVANAPSLIGGAVAAGPDRVDLVAGYYDNVLHFLHGHHEGEDLVVWPTLCERAPDQADEVRRIAAQHDDVTALLDDATASVAQWRAAPDEDSAASAAAAVSALGAALLPHLDQEESFIVPLAAKHIFAPEWGELPSHGMRTFSGDKLWLILGLIREQMRPDQIASMDAHMPPPVAQMWSEQGERAFTEFVTALRS